MEGPWDVKESNPWATLSAAKDESAEWFVSSNAGGGLSSSSTTGNPTAKPTAASPSKWGQRVQDVDDFEIANDWRFNGSGDSGERSLYDDTGTPMIRETTAHPILGSKSFPILAVEEGSLNRPISIHDADLLDEREKDVLRQAARKKQPDSIQIMETADARDQDVLQQAAVKRQQERTAHTVLPNSFSLSSNDAVKKEDINNKQKGIMGFFRGNVRLL